MSSIKHTAAFIPRVEKKMYNDILKTRDILRVPAFDFLQNDPDL